VHTAHGELPVPAPATMALLRGCPVRPGGEEAELTTPTGAALLVALVDAWEPPPLARLLATACGAGARQFANRPNVLRASLYEATGTDGAADQVAVIECNLDDMPGETLSWLGPRLLEVGALDYAVLPATMKKGRQGMVLQVLCPPAALPLCADCLLRETPSLGVRYHYASRIMLRREERTVATPWGEIQAKFAYDQNGNLLRVKPAAEDCARLAATTGIAYTSLHRQIQAQLDRELEQPREHQP